MNISDIYLKLLSYIQQMATCHYLMEQKWDYVIVTQRPPTDTSLLEPWIQGSSLKCVVFWK